MNAWRRLALVYLALLLLSMVTTRLGVVAPLAVTSAVQPVTHLFGAASASLRGAVTAFAVERDLAARNRDLTSKNGALQSRLNFLERENERLRQAARISATQSPSLETVASVTEVDPSPLLSRLTVNKGAADGVRPLMPATVPAGLVGQVTSVNGREAVILTILDPESRVGVTLRGKGGRGLAVGAPPDRLRAEFPLSVPVALGDEVLTSSLGGVYPVGIKVGTVERLLPLGPNDVRRAVIVKPSADIGTVEEVGLLEPL